jgi:hypothetical protein
VHLVIFAVLQEKSFVEQFPERITQFSFLVSVQVKFFEQKVELYRN